MSCTNAHFFIDILEPIKGNEDLNTLLGPFNNFLPVKRRKFGLYRAVYFDDRRSACKNTYDTGITFPVMCVRRQNDRSQFPEEKIENENVPVYWILLISLAVIGVVYSITIIMQSRPSSISDSSIETDIDGY